MLNSKNTFKRGIHPNDNKNYSKDYPIEVLPLPKEIIIPLLQHIGAPLISKVQLKQNVNFGEMIADSDNFVSAPAYSSLKGIVSADCMITLPNGRHVSAVSIKADEGENPGVNLWKELSSDNWNTAKISEYTPQDIQKKVREAGIVGLGGAAFPTHVKMSINPSKPVDTLLVNGCECEPYLTSDYRLMIEASNGIINGAKIAAKATGSKNIIIAVEDNKPLAISALKKAAENTEVKILEMETKYPMGGEKQLIVAALKREIPSGGLPADAGVAVINVGTSLSICAMLLKNLPLTHRVISVSGSGINQPKNLFVPIGTKYSDIIEYCGGLKTNVKKVISGGPMMGFTIGNLDIPVTKGTSGLTILSEKDTDFVEETNCIRCAKCVDVCPLHLVPTKIAHAAKFENWELAKQYYISLCCECGCCTYTCPSGIPLVQLIRAGKAKMPRN